MRSMLIFILISFTMFACQSTNNVEPEKKHATAAMVKAPVQNAKVAERDSIPTRRSSMIVDRSRQKDAINASFPFDIPLEDISKKVKPSNEIIPKNGKPTVVLFWLTTCYPCRLEMKAIAAKYEEWQKQSDFNMVAISTDWDKNFDSFVKMVETNKWPWEAYRDVNREFRKVLPGELNGLPQSFIFDKHGEIAYHSRKYRTGDEDKLFAKIQSLN